MSRSSRASNLLDLLLSSRSYRASERAYEDRGVAEQEPFPFLAIVGQKEMKLALVLALINPNIGGVLLVGSRGTAKTTAVRGLVDLLPSVTTSLCLNGEGCTETRIEEAGMDAVCLQCATRYGHGEPLSESRRVRIVELPLNARLDDVVGGIDERAALERRQVRLEQGLLAQADGNILYIDEVNLLDSVIADAILDAAAQGHYTVWRGPLKLTYQARFVLIGSMNPEEGRLRPQIMDRFGLRVLVRGLPDSEERYEVYRRTTAYQNDSERMAAAYAAATLAVAEEIERARALLPEVTIGDAARSVGLALIEKMGIDSSRAEMTLFETARAHAAADGRDTVGIADIDAVALPALRLRQSPGLASFFQTQDAEDAGLREILKETRGESG